LTRRYAEHCCAANARQQRCPPTPLAWLGLQPQAPHCSWPLQCRGMQRKHPLQALRPAPRSLHLLHHPLQERRLPGPPQRQPGSCGGCQRRAFQTRCPWRGRPQLCRLPSRRCPRLWAQRPEGQG
jgi:hypothetical protein